MLLDAISNLEGRAESRIDLGQGRGGRVLVKDGAGLWLADADQEFIAGGRRCTT